MTGTPGQTWLEPLKITREDGSYVRLEYDPTLRIKTEEYHAAGGAITETITYTYDAAGNRTAHTNAAGAHVYDVQPGYKLAGVDGPGTNDQSFTHDTGGRVTGIARGGQTFDLGYNAAGQITSVAGSAAVTYAYDGQGRRTKATSGTAVRNFLVAPTATGGLDAPQLLSNAAGSVLAGFVYGPGGGGDAPLMRFDASGNPIYYLQDAMGSAVGRVDQALSSVSKVNFDAFGNIRSGTAGSSFLGGEFGFHGAWRETATGLYHMHARDYDPATARFTSRTLNALHDKVMERRPGQWAAIYKHAINHQAVPITLFIILRDGWDERRNAAQTAAITGEAVQRGVIMMIVNLTG